MPLPAPPFLSTGNLPGLHKDKPLATSATRLSREILEGGQKEGGDSWNMGKGKIQNILQQHQDFQERKGTDREETELYYITYDSYEWHTTLKW